MVKLFQKNAKWNLLQVILGTAEKFLLVLLLARISEITDVAIEGDLSVFMEKIPPLIVTLGLEVLFFYAVKAVAIRIRICAAAGLRNRIYTTLLYHDVQSGTENEGSDNILNIYNSQIDQLSALASQSGELGIAILTLLIAAAYIASVNLKLLITSVIFIPLSSYLYERLMIPLRHKRRIIMDEKKGVNRVVKENLDGFYIVRAFGLSDFFLDKFRKHSDTIRRTEKEIDRIGAVLSRVSIMLRYLPQLIIPLYGGLLAYRGELSVGELLAVNTVIAYIFQPVEKMAAIRKRRKELTPVIENISALLQDETNQHSDENTLSSEPIQTLEFAGLNFGYTDDSRILRNMDFSIHRGEHILLLGESGIGKSTLAKIICGMEKDFTGKFRLNGREVSEAGIEAVSERVAYVPQNPWIFADSIKNNICMGREITAKQLKRIEELSGVAQFLERFPDGHDTLLGENGVRLSGGQCKRIAVARAMAADRDFYILDEPTASLDKEGGAQMMQNLSEFCADKAMLIISHSINDMPPMDAVYTMREGRLCNE